jgi:polar amino acid transport system substrate-binding protein
MHLSTRGAAARLTLIGVVLALAACSAAATPAPTAAPTAAPVTAAPSAASVAPPTASPSPSPTGPDCSSAALKTLTAGKLTIGTDNPAFSPWWAGPAPVAGSPWQYADPNNGQGLEGATAYLIAKALGFAKTDVTWVEVHFDAAIQPGPKKFDLYLAQVSYSAERANAVDLSDGYFDDNQAVVGFKANAISKVTTVAGLKDFRLGTQVGTTSLKYIQDNIAPTKEPRVYNTLDAAVKALQAKQIDGLVADLGTTFFVRDAELTGGVIVGELPTVGAQEHFSAVLNKGSSLTVCVNQAIAAIKADGSLDAARQQYITSEGAPKLP